jgi:hypothetical protein
MGQLIIKNAQDEELTITHPDNAGAISLSSDNLAPKDSPVFTGNVGIGTDNPNLSSGYNGLNVENNGYTQLKLSSTVESAGLELLPQSGHQYEIQANVSNDFFVYNRTNEAYNLIIDGAGRVTMPYQPAFIASGGGGDISTGDTKITCWTNAELNVGGHYNTTTNTFTAPAKGLYYFIASPWKSTSATEAGIVFKKNGSQIAESRAVGDSGEYEQIMLTTIVHLEVGDYIEVFTTTYGGVVHFANRQFTIFGGYLIR